MASSQASLMRIAACVEYNGAGYCGWQRQVHSPSVQAEVEKAISKVANEPITVITAGRTDTGVHGIGQVVHFDTTSMRKPYEWLRGVNTFLPNDISLIWTHPVPADFHARFSAVKRSYRYVILNRRVSPSYLHQRVTWCPVPLNSDLMGESAQALIGTHDFSAFRASSCQSKDPVKTITALNVQQSGNWIWIDVVANGFLHHMVRNIAGSLMRVGEGLESVEWVATVLDSGDRRKGGVTALADGLYFVSVQYPEQYQLPLPPPACRFW